MCLPSLHRLLPRQFPGGNSLEPPLCNSLSSPPTLTLSTPTLNERLLLSSPYTLLWTLTPQTCRRKVRFELRRITGKINSTETELALVLGEEKDSRKLGKGDTGGIEVERGEYVWRTPRGGEVEVASNGISEREFYWEVVFEEGRRFSGSRFRFRVENATEAEVRIAGERKREISERTKREIGIGVGASVGFLLLVGLLFLFFKRRREKKKRDLETDDGSSETVEYGSVRTDSDRGGSSPVNSPQTGTRMGTRGRSPKHKNFLSSFKFKSRSKPKTPSFTIIRRHERAEKGPEAPLKPRKDSEKPLILDTTPGTQISPVELATSSPSELQSPTTPRLPTRQLYQGASSWASPPLNVYDSHGISSFQSSPSRTNTPRADSMTIPYSASPLPRTTSPQGLLSPVSPLTAHSDRSFTHLGRTHSPLSQSDIHPLHRTTSPAETLNSSDALHSGSRSVKSIDTASGGDINALKARQVRIRKEREYVQRLLDMEREEEEVEFEIARMGAGAGELGSGALGNGGLGPGIEVEMGEKAGEGWVGGMF